MLRFLEIQTFDPSILWLVDFGLTSLNFLVDAPMLFLVLFLLNRAAILADSKGFCMIVDVLSKLDVTNADTPLNFLDCENIDAFSLGICSGNGWTCCKLCPGLTR